ncbi:MAG: hypothetical protein AAB433_09535, partial [Nitrospirota bacterium]
EAGRPRAARVGEGSRVPSFHEKGHWRQGGLLGLVDFFSPSRAGLVRPDPRTFPAPVAGFHSHSVMRSFGARCKRGSVRRVLQSDRRAVSRDGTTQSPGRAV